MKLTTLLPLATLWSAAAAETEYFFRFTQSAKWPAINNQRLRSNASDTPGVTSAPYNAEDHFNRIAWANPQDPYTPLLVVPTNPHPPPVPGYYGLTGRDGVPDALRLVYTYRPEDEEVQGRSFYYEEWHLQRVPGKCQPNSGKLVLRYRPTTGWQWRWFAVKEKTPAGIDKWVPWYIKTSPNNVDILATWDYDPIELDLVEAGPINSEAPGGVEE